VDSGTPVVHAAGLTKSYKRAVALRGVDIDVAAGEVVGLLGPNGAGKSTLTKVLCGLVRADGGVATISGAPAGSSAARSKIGYLAELFRFPGWANAREVLTTHQQLAGHAPADGWSAERSRLLSEVGLTHTADTRVEAMSKGMQQRLGLAQAMVGDPAVLLLDEPTSALDPAGRHTVREVLARARDRGTAVLLNTHLLGEVELLADRVVLIDAGKVVAAGTIAELTGQHGVTVETDRGRVEQPNVAHEQIPDLVARLVAEGRKVYAVIPHQSSLEQLYLDLVGDRESQR
ncbi:MAG TPA: ABC transporter ATP-binding protein, partial [Mycobacteriales bacterium]|nr:ABC transporter ATP-binding protein [Mycobacteriales bacterium]